MIEENGTSSSVPHVLIIAEAQGDPRLEHGELAD